jgi:hypothetical protein
MGSVSVTCLGRNLMAEGDPRYLALLDEMRALHLRKVADYGMGQDPLYNLHASVEFGVPPWKATILRANDKWTRIKAFCPWFCSERRRTMEKIPLLDHGYLLYIEHWGSDERIIEAARMSTGKGFLGWEPGVCPTCSGKKGWEEDTGGTLPWGEPTPPIWVLCADCGGIGTIAGDKNLLRRLWVKKHATPFEMAGLIVEVQAPIMVFREWHRLTY